MKSQEAAVLDHEYDGIREYDNPTPGWWHTIFAGTIVFAMFYLTFWHFSPLALSVQDKWENDQLEDYKRIFGAVGDLKPDQDTILRMMGNQQMLDVAKSLFIGNCAVCHGKDAGGINGVNLTDEYYKNVKKIEDIYTTISKGANLGAMPSWEQKLSKNERVILAAYVATLRGKNVPGRPPEGDQIPPWPPIPPPTAVPAAK
jgi:cytochrome c oxidase cbb3-type subunit 3